LLEPTPLYTACRRRELALTSRQTYAPPAVRRILEHPAFEEVIAPRLAEPFDSNAERGRWLAHFNFTHPARQQLTVGDLVAYKVWLEMDRPNPLPAPSRPVSVAIGASDGAGSGRKRAVLTPSSQDLYRTHSLKVRIPREDGEAICAIPLDLAHLAASRAPQRLRSRLELLLSGEASRLPVEPDAESLKALVWFCNEWEREMPRAKVNVTLEGAVLEVVDQVRGSRPRADAVRELLEMVARGLGPRV
jgi:hypothetical protein